MSKKPPELDKSWLGPLVLINVFIWLIFITPEANAVFCNATTNCLVEWVGALSGWAAAFAALLTVYIMRQQFYKQQEQLDNQQKQIDFQLGDVKPLVYATNINSANLIKKDVVIHIQNYNKRPVIIKKIHCSEDFQIEINASSFQTLQSDTNEYLISGGYINLTLPKRKSVEDPSSANIKLQVIFKPSIYKSAGERLPRSREVIYYIEGEQISDENERFILSCKCVSIFPC